MKTQVLLFLLGIFGGRSEIVSVMEGYPVTLHTDIKTDQQQDIKWYFNNTRIAQINGDSGYTCTDVKCNEDTERFRNRLELDYQTGSLTIKNTKKTDSGNYSLDIFSNVNHVVKIFSVYVYGVSAGPIDEVRRISVEEGKSVDLDSGVARKPNDDLTTWHFNDILIAEVTGEQSRICANDQCMKLFKDRLKLDNHTGSLTITNITTEQAGLYNLHMVSSGSRIHRRRRESIQPVLKSFHVDVTKAGLSSAIIAVICVAVALPIAVIALCSGWICYQKNQGGNNSGGIQQRDEPGQNMTPLMTASNSAANGNSQPHS